MQQKKPFYFINTSNALVPSNPNTIRDMGEPRNCTYLQLDTMDSAKDVTWRAIAKCDKELDKILSPNKTKRNS